MKLLAVILLAACLAQGTNAQLLAAVGLEGAASGVAGVAAGATGAVGSAASSTVGAVGAAASTTTGAVGGSASATVGAVGGAAAQLPGVGKLSAAAKGMLGSAVEGVSSEKLTEAADKLNLKEALVTIQGAQNAVNELTKTATSRLDRVVAGPMASSGCAKDKVEAAATLSKNMAHLPIRAATLTKDGLLAYHACSKEDGYWSKKKCQALKLTPVTVKAAVLVYDTHKYSREATATVMGANAALKECASKVAA